MKNSNKKIKYISIILVVAAVIVAAIIALVSLVIDVPQNLKCTYKDLAGSNFTSGIAKIEWNESKNAKGYEVYSKKGSNYEPLGTTSDTSYTIENLKEGETYTIAVKAYKDEKNSDTYSDYSQPLDINISKNDLGVKVYNGNMIGTVTNGVYSYKGIHYAKDTGTPETRWKKPVPVDASNNDVDASEYGKTAFQVPWHSEAASVEEQSEDCLTLDVWTNTPNDTKAKKPVFVWIHGGSNLLGGSCDPAYCGQNMIEACGDDVVYVAINYRVNCMGVMNFSQIEGGENYPDSGWLSLYDDIQALRWVKQNIEQFGGDPSQVTIGGESVGGTHVSLLPLMEECEKEGLFNRVICQSGTPMMTLPEASSYESTKVMMDGYKNAESVATERHAAVPGLGKGVYPTMNDLANLSQEEMWRLMYYSGSCSWDEESQRAYSVTESMANTYFPIRGGQDNPLLHSRFDNSVEKLFEQYQNLNYFDLMIGSTSDETDYWIGEASNKYMYDEKGNVMTYTALDGSQKPVIDIGALPTDDDYSRTSDKNSATWNNVYSKLLEKFGISEAADSALQKAIAGNTGDQKGVAEEAMKASMMQTEIAFALPAQLIANNHSKSGRDTYVYYWKQPYDCPGLNAGHAVELPYEFSVDSDGDLNNTSNKAEVELMDKTMKTWISFIKNGKPNVVNQGIEWPKYDEQTKTTMVINDVSKNSNWTVEQDPDSELRDLLTNKNGTCQPVEIKGNTYTSFFDFAMKAIVLKERAD